LQGRAPGPSPGGGNFNQALIFYHFGDVERPAARRPRPHQRGAHGPANREAVRRPGTIEDRIRMATDLYREDLQTGHITIISELIAGSLARPDLGPEVVARMEPWVELVEDELFRPAGRVAARQPARGRHPVPPAGLRDHRALPRRRPCCRTSTTTTPVRRPCSRTAGKLAPMLAPLMGELPQDPDPGSGGGEQ